jgi:hypothetical protein
MACQLLLVAGLAFLPASPLRALLFEEAVSPRLVCYLGVLLAANLLFLEVRKDPGFVSFEVPQQRRAEETELVEEPEYLDADPKLRGSLKMKELRENFLEPYYNPSSREEARPRRPNREAEPEEGDEEAGEEEQGEGQFDSAETFRDM